MFNGSSTDWIWPLDVFWYLVRNLLLLKPGNISDVTILKSHSLKFIAKINKKRQIKTWKRVQLEFIKQQLSFSMMQKVQKSAMGVH